MTETNDPAVAPLLLQPVLVVEQKKKLLDVATDYAIFSEGGDQVGSVRQVDQSAGQKLLRFVSSFDKYMKFSFAVADASGNVVLKLTRPAKFIKSQLHVDDAAGNRLGEIVQQNMIGKIDFALESNGATIGEMTGKSWRDRKFTISDQNGNQVAEVSKRWAGLRGVFHAEDKYVVRFESDVPEPLRSLAVAASVCMDVALHQEEN